MIRIGILSGDVSGTESIKLIQQFKDFKITGIVQDIDHQGSEDQQYTTEDLLANSDAIFVNVQTPSFELMRMAIKKSNHLFLKRIPKLSVGETRQLINLANESGSTILLFNPLTFLDENLKIQSHLNKQKLITIRLPLSKTDIENQLLDLLLFITSTEKSEVKKTDIFAFDSAKATGIISIRLAFATGSIAQIELGGMFTSNQSFVEIFQKDESYISLPTCLPASKTRLRTEKNALEHFRHGIQHKSAISISLNELEQAIICMNEIRDKLKFLNCQLLG
jgi:hypothetical protein